MKVAIFFILLLYVAYGKSESCSNLFLKWHEIPNTTHSVDAYLIPGAKKVLSFGNYEHIKTLDKDNILLTESFFKESGIPIPKDAIKIEAKTYSYYLKNSYSTRSNRGSGRGHILKTPLNKDVKLEFKGSGTNKYYSGANSRNFEPDDYRRNGLAVMDELTTEMIIGRIFEKRGVPQSMSFEMKMLPEFIQKLTRKDRGFSRSAVQVTRIMNRGRDSLYPGLKALEEDKIKLIGRMYAINGQLGAINPENMTLGAKLLDLGHSNIGYPLISGAYRCTLCEHIDGSSWDRTLVGLFDYYYENIPSLAKIKKYNNLVDEKASALLREYNHHRTTGKYFHSKADWEHFLDGRQTILTYEDTYLIPKMRHLYSDFSWWKSRQRTLESKGLSEEELYQFFIDHNFRTKYVSYAFDIKKSTLEKFVNELTADIGVKKLGIELQDKHVEALTAAIREEIRIVRRWDDVNKYGSNILGMQLPSLVAPERVSFSLKSLMQFAGLKKFISPKEYAELKKLIGSITDPLNQHNAIILLNLFETIFAKNAITKRQLKLLYKEYYPANIIERKVRDSLDVARDADEAIKITQKLVDEISKGVEVSPRKYFEEIKSLAKRPYFRRGDTY